jgi:hypothetical protein
MADITRLEDIRNDKNEKVREDTHTNNKRDIKGFLKMPYNISIVIFAVLGFVFFPVSFLLGRFFIAISLVLSATPKLQKQRQSLQWQESVHLIATGLYILSTSLAIVGFAVQALDMFVLILFIILFVDSLRTYLKHKDK